MSARLTALCGAACLLHADVALSVAMSPQQRQQQQQDPTPPAQPPFKSPAPAFPTAWFGGDPNGFEYQDPRQLKKMAGNRAVFMSWPEMMPASDWSNGTEVMAAACTGFKDALGPNGTAVFGCNSHGRSCSSRVVQSDLSC